MATNGQAHQQKLRLGCWFQSSATRRGYGDTEGTGAFGLSHDVSILCDEEGVWRPATVEAPTGNWLYVSILCDEEGVWRPSTVKPWWMVVAFRFNPLRRGGGMAT